MKRTLLSIIAVFALAGPSVLADTPNAIDTTVPEDDVDTSCDGDLDGSRVVDSSDLTILLAQYGSRCRRCAADLNNDFFVDDEDLEILMTSWGACGDYELATQYELRAMRAIDDGAEIEMNDGSNDGDGVVVDPRRGRDSLQTRYEFRVMQAVDDGAEIETDDGQEEVDEPEEPRCEGDLNGDNVVDRSDLANMLRSFGRCYGCQADLNGDHYVDETDVRILSQNWGPCAEYELDTQHGWKSTGMGK